MAGDPFSRGYAAIVAICRNHPAVSELIKAKNLIDYSGSDPAPEKSHRLASDVPELAFLPSGFQFTRLSSHVTDVRIGIAIGIITGTLNVSTSGAVFPVLWALAKAMQTFQSGIREHAVPHLSDVAIEAMDLNMTAESDKPAIRDGWMGVCEATLIYHIPHSELNA